MIVIHVNVRDRIATCPVETVYVSGNTLDCQVQFHFDREWDNYDPKTARFIYDGNRMQERIFYGDVIEGMPSITNTNTLEIGVYAGDLIVSSRALINVVYGTLDGSPVREDPEEDVYNQIITLLDGMDEKIGNLDDLETEAKDSIVDAINEAAQSGGGGAGGAVSSVNGQTGNVVLTADDVGALPDDTYIPEALSHLSDDSQHRTVTDAEKSAWNAKQNAIPPNTYDSYGSAATVQGNLETESSELNGAINAINAKIPSQASQQNLLADRDFVNSSVQSATSNFRGNWNAWSDVPSNTNLYPQDWKGSRVPTVNDYMVVGDAADYTESSLSGTWRFKYNGVWETDGISGWNPEYRVNETPFTSDQLAALNSDVTAEKVLGYDGHVEDDDIHVTAAQKTAWSGKQDAITDQNKLSLSNVSGYTTQQMVVTYDDNTTQTFSVVVTA